MPPSIRTAATLLAAGLALATTPAWAGRAQVGTGAGTWSDWGLDQASATGQGWRDGLLVQDDTKTGDPSSVAVQVHDAAHAARAEASAQALLRQPDGLPGLAFSGRRAVESDRDAGRLSLLSETTRAAYTTAGGSTRQGYVSGYSFAELFETFDVFYARDRAGPVQVTLTLTLDGRIDGRSGGNGWIDGVQVYAALGGVDTGVAQDMFAPVWRSEVDVANQVLTFTGTLANSSCPAVGPLCDGFIGLYVGLDLRGRRTSDDRIDFIAGAPSVVDIGMRVALSVGPDVTLHAMAADGTLLPAPAWATVAVVPEPGTWALWLGGLVLLGGWRQRRRRPR